MNAPPSPEISRPLVVHARTVFNQQQILPLVQALALPLYWLIGREAFGLEGLAAAVFMLLAPFCAHSIVVGIGFVVAYVNQHERSGLRHSRRRDWLIAFVREAAVSIRQFYWLMPFRAGFRPPEPTQSPRRLPVILVHGYGCNRGLWLPAVKWLSRKGYRVSALDLHPLHCSIDIYAPAIAHEVERVKAATGSRRVVVIGHSMGGLAARAYLRHCEERHQDPGLAALITLGTPHRGTHIAHIGLGENARQMRFRGTWVTQLERHDQQPRGSDAPSTALSPGCQVVSITSLQDNIVSRPFEQRIARAGARSVVVRRQGHMSLATSERIFRLIDRILSSPRVQRPPP